MNAAEEPAWVAEVLDFWFRELGEAQWFAKSESVDGQIRERFLALHEQLVADGVPAAAPPRTVLAAVLVLDQFSRNLFRGSPRAFAADPQARQLARQAVGAGLDAGMTHAERLFLYLPFEHSEDLDDQRRAVELISPLGHEGWTRYAKAHQSVIERFGRFPHRNAALGRTSTAAEIAALKEPMTSF